MNPDFRALFESAPGLYLVLDPELTIIAVSDSYAAATLTQRDQILGRNIFDVFPDNPNDVGATGVSNLRASLERVLAQGKPDTMAVQKYDIRRPESQGGGFEERFWSPSNSPVKDASGGVRYIIHTAQDVTEFVRLRQAGQAQHSITEQLRSRAGHMEAEIYRRAQEIQESNHQLRQLKAELESRVELRNQQLVESHEALKRSEEQLRQSQKLEAIGHLAGGIAHDFNNLLSVILSFTEMATWNVTDHHPVRGDLDQISRAANRAAELTRQLLAFSRRQVLDLRIIDVNQVVESTSAMLNRVLGEDIKLQTLLLPSLAKTVADPGQLEQVLLNLAVNARDAMPNGGRLIIETADVELDVEYASQHLGAIPGPHVMLAVSDTGVGMDKETQARIFEPFFTTKPPGKGTGLGLSTVFGIVKQCGGHIWLYSEVGKGTSFKIYLPRTEGAANWSPKTAALTSNGNRGTETILLVEDEEQVRAVAASSLRRLGYNVLETRTPKEALLACEQHPHPIHLLLTDVVMPQMNGRDLAEKVHSLRPGIHALFMSGYTDHVIANQGVLGPGDSFLQKPFTPTVLGRRVRELLDKAPERVA